MKSFDPRFSPRYRPPRSRSSMLLDVAGGLLRGRGLIILAALAVLGIAVWAGSRGDDGPDPDGELASHVVDALTRAGYGDLTVTVDAQVATITGQLATETDAAVVEGIATSVRDVVGADVQATISGAAPEDDILDPGEATAVEVDLQHDLTQLTTLDPIRFDTGSTDISAESQDTITAVAALLNQNVDVRIRIEGHTDSDGDPQANRDLSQQRAEQVLAALQGQGVDPARLQAQGFGADQPIADNATQEGKERNRRIEFRVLTGDAPIAGLEGLGGTTTTLPDLSGLTTSTAPA